MWGLSFTHERRWRLSKGDFSAEISDYNWEITGFDAVLNERHPDDIHYGGNAYWVVGAFADREGYTVKKLPRHNANAKQERGEKP